MFVVVWNTGESVPCTTLQAANDLAKRRGAAVANHACLDLEAQRIYGVYADKGRIGVVVECMNAKTS